jgi:protein tyrosine kinase modulator
MNELYRELLGYLRGMWHRRWIGLAVAWLAAIIGVVAVYRIPERYEASARVYVDTQSLLQPLLAGLAIQPNLDQQVALMSRTLISRPNVDKLVRMADLDLRVKTQSERDDLIDSVMRTVGLTGNVQANLYVISYRDANPEQARKVVQSLLGIFVESSLGDKKQDTQTAMKFVDDQVKRYEESLQAAENRLKEFKLKYLGTNRDGMDYFARMSRLRNEIEAARLDVQSAEQARDSYKRELSGEAPPLMFAESAPDVVAVPEIDARLGQLKRELDDLRRKYTDQPKGSVPVERDPVSQQMRISLAEAEATLASAKAKLVGYESQYRTLGAQAAVLPGIEAEYAQLNRDYDVQKRTYEALVTRRESAIMGKDVQDSGGARFRIIDPPRVSLDPVPPRRMSLLAVAFAAALGAGFVASFLASQVLPIFHDARGLRDVSKRPILGMVSLLTSDLVMRRKRRNAFLFAGGVGGFIASCSAVLAITLMIGRAS